MNGFFFNLKKSYLNDLKKYPNFQFIASAYVPYPVVPMCDGVRVLKKKYKILLPATKTH